MPELDVYEKAFIFSLIPYIRYDNAIKTLNGHELNVDKMVEISGISKRKVQSILQGLMNKGIMNKENKGKKNIYYINPSLFNKGNRIDSKIQKMFFE